MGLRRLGACCWGELFNVKAALEDPAYCQHKWDQLNKHNLACYSLSNHLAGQAVCDLIDERHKAILPPHVWGDGNPEGVRQRAAKEMMDTARAARKFFDIAPPAIKTSLQRVVVNGFTGSSIWHLLYSFPPVLPRQIEAGYEDFAQRWRPIMDVFHQEDVWFGLEVHPTEIAFDIASTERAIDAIGGHERFGFNYDPSHFGYQHVDYVGFIRQFRDRIYHCHAKDVYWSAIPDQSGRFRRAPRFRSPRPVLGFPLVGPRLDRLPGRHPRLERDRLSGTAFGRVGRQRHGPRARCRRGAGVHPEDGFRVLRTGFRLRIRQGLNRGRFPASPFPQ